MLGCSGGEAPGLRSTSVRVGDSLLVDAGCAASTLEPEAQVRLRDVLLTHAHLDHVKELPFLCENRLAAGGGPLRVHGTLPTLDRLRAHLLNDALHPDWTRVPGDRPMLELLPIEPGRRFAAGGLGITATALDHPGGSLAFVLEGGRGILVWAGDTGPAPGLWTEVARHGARARAVAVEVSFPNRLEALALATGHLTPGLLRRDLDRIAEPPPIWIHHLKPATRDETLADLRAAGLPPWRALEDGARIEVDLGVAPR